VALLTLSAATSLMVLLVGLDWAVARDRLIYVDAGEMAAVDWLGTSRGAGLPPAVLTSTDTGLYVPARAGDRVFVGHYSETIDYLRKARVAFDAYRAGPAAVVSVARAEDTQYVFYGPLEQAVAGPGFGSAPPDGLDVVYNVDGVVIYRLR
jgi:hypothetical protein